jgi:FecR protein
VARHRRIENCGLLVGLLLASELFSISAFGARPTEAQLTALVGNANLKTSAGTRLASIGERVGEVSSINTGADSRVELTFNNRAVARLSANAILSLKNKNDLELSRGAVLLEFPSGAKGKIQAGRVATALSHATAVFEYQSAAFKLLVLEGTARLYRPGKLGDSILVRAGQMVFGNANASLTDPVDFDIERFVKTCPLIQNFALLENERAIAAANQRQQRDKSKKRLLDTNLIMFGGGSTVSIVDPAKVKSDVSSVSTTGTSHGAQTSVAPEPSEEVRP